LINLANPQLLPTGQCALIESSCREIHAADERQDVIPLPDVINIMSLFATVGCAVVLPIATESYFWLSRMVVGGAYILIAFHPLAA
jgi:hypothetical protein